MWLLSNKITIKDSGLLEGFCDFHSHLLPGVDDGVGHAKETIRILKKWEFLGVSEVWMTPHIMEDVPNKPTELNAKFERFKTEYQGQITLHLAAENMIDGLFARRVEENELMPIDREEDKWLLIETSYFIPPMNMEKMIDCVKTKGYIPVLAHPERYQYMDTKDYKKWKHQGVHFQLNLPSLVGVYGLEVQKKAEWLLRHDMYDCCGTDTHSADQAEDFLNSIINKKTLKSVKAVCDKKRP